MVVANHIPEERKLACGKHQIEPREISERRFREVAAEVGYIFLSERPSTGSEAAPIQVKAERTVLVPPGSQAESETNLSDAAGTDEPTRDGDAKEMGHEEYWQRRSSPEAMALLERFTQLLADRSVAVKMSFRKHGLCVTGKLRLARIIPSRSAHCTLRFDNGMPPDALKEGRNKLEERGRHFRGVQDRRSSLTGMSKAVDAASQSMPGSSLARRHKSGPTPIQLSRAQGSFKTLRTHVNAPAD